MVFLLLNLQQRISSLTVADSLMKSSFSVCGSSVMSMGIVSQVGVVLFCHSKFMENSNKKSASVLYMWKDLHTKNRHALHHQLCN